MINRTTAIFVLCALFFIAPGHTRASAPLFEKGGLTLKKMSEAIDMAEYRGKFRLLLNYEQGSIQARKFDEGADSRMFADIYCLKMKKGSYKVSDLKADVSSWKLGDLSGDLSRARKKYFPWESSRHFALAVSEEAMFNIFIPWALARLGRDWENSTEEMAVHRISVNKAKPEGKRVIDTQCFPAGILICCPVNNELRNQS